MFSEYSFIPWGDIIQPFSLSIAFFYWAYAIQNYPLPTRLNLPKFMLNKNLMLSLGFINGAIAVYRFF